MTDSRAAIIHMGLFAPQNDVRNILNQPGLVHRDQIAARSGAPAALKTSRGCEKKGVFGVGQACFRVLGWKFVSDKGFETVWPTG